MYTSAPLVAADVYIVNLLTIGLNEVTMSFSRFFSCREEAEEVMRACALRMRSDQIVTVQERSEAFGGTVLIGVAGPVQELPESSSPQPAAPLVAAMRTHCTPGGALTAPSSVEDSRRAELIAAFEKIDQMTGAEFEEFLEGVFGFCGVATRRTPSGADQGADLIAETLDGVLVAVQAKRYAGRVGNAAVQEVHAAITFFDCQLGVVIATAPCTEAARKLAAKCKVRLWDRSKLLTLLVGDSTFDAMLYDRDR
jgi:HJR/Mrr/RecB family endonuclease